MNKISDLKSVDINWHTIFRYNGAKSIRTKANAELIKMLKDRNIPTSWGFFAKIFLRSEYREYIA
ncbi:hypothetical protein D1BOALGB6SA_1709 [Olavius sp. associated proteobacterium Delta 1]|nr:hypothetical protein D1BOALGB6SA_1709 [Olavius sp. associated proteobacterium Delta 1]